MDIEKWIVVTPGIRSGKPCIVGTRIAVYDILDYLAGGMSEQEILKDFPSLRPEHIKASLALWREHQVAQPNDDKLVKLAFCMGTNASRGLNSVHAG